jgi:hypothetical protein
MTDAPHQFIRTSTLIGTACILAILAAARETVRVSWLGGGQ